MTFGKRFSTHYHRPPVMIETSCLRCYGTGHLRERGNRIICKTCGGKGKVVAATPASNTTAAA